MKKIKKEHWTGFNAYLKWKGDMEKAMVFYQSKGINIKKGFIFGWNLAQSSVAHKDGAA